MDRPRHLGTKTMFTPSKTAATLCAALAVVTLTLASVGSAEAKMPFLIPPHPVKILPPAPGPHPHHHGNGFAYGAAGLVAGLAVGSMIAASRTTTVSDCVMVERVDRWGNVIGTRRVCDDE